MKKTAALSAIPVSGKTEIGGALKNYLRRWARRDVDVPSKIDLILDKGGKYTTGKAVVKNISLSGALLTDISLQKSSLPIKRFTIHLSFNLKTYKGLGAIARPVHFGDPGREFELGIEFVDLWIDAGK